MVNDGVTLPRPSYHPVMNKRDLTHIHNFLRDSHTVMDLTRIQSQRMCRRIRTP